MSTIDQRSRRRMLAAVGSCVGGVLAGCVGSSNPGNSDASSETGGEWPTAGHDPANTRHAPDAATVSSTPKEAWRLPIGSPSHPVATNRRVYIPDGTVLRVHDAVTGDERWTYEHENGGSLTAPTVKEGRVYLGVTEGSDSVVALDGASGERQWTFGPTGAGSVSGTPTLNEAGDTVFVGTDTERFYALDASTGEPRWQEEVYGPVTTTPAVRSPLVVVTTRAGEVYAFEEDGTALWRGQLRQGSETPPVISERTVFVGGTGGYVYAFDPVSGGVRWDTYVEKLYRGGFVVRYSSVYAVSGRSVTALGGEKGEIKWSVDLGGFIECAPMLLDDTLYVGGPRLFALKSSGGIGVATLRFGSTHWSANLGRRVGPGIAAADGRLFAPVELDDGSHELLALEES